LAGTVALAVLIARSDRIVIVEVEVNEDAMVSSLAKVAISRLDAGEQGPA
jgi:hypothetical protein